MAETCDAVSRAVAVAMADGALAASRADVALAITGIAGAGAEGDEAGLVLFACVRLSRVTAPVEKHFGGVGHGAGRHAALRTAVKMMRDASD